jgi:hypothetical protein
LSVALVNFQVSTNAGELWRILILSSALAWLYCGSSAHATARVALVIGNSTYRHLPILSNPANDAAAVAAMLRAAGFDSVETRSNLTADEMRKGSAATAGMPRSQ